MSRLDFSMMASGWLRRRLVNGSVHVWEAEEMLTALALF
ncbi:hypothetical protein F3Y22_tig00117056pilonHSYRG00513 [Hibiscus syriacus]|uniref:Uncharacterized protein n=1 Tax=Hibiscus syriacus TaxID=106335 RepID=A0A6A2WVU2_HIBSY|nr:hypothetical protein F3Y22_tig00117056pilonHSYRG00513 [Hibiscus syriacus]